MALVAVVSDTHLPRGSRRLPEECLRRLAAADLIVHAGDLCSLGALAELHALGPPVAAVHGNADHDAVRAALPAELVAEVGGARVAVTHDAGRREGREARLVARFGGCEAVVYGHSHLPQVSRHGGVWILNPGSPTERRRAPSRTMLELDVEAGQIQPRLIELT